MDNHIIELKNISLKVKNSDDEILKSINFTLRRHDFVVLVGSNGSGKSSLLKLINQSYLPTSGTIDYCGVNHNGAHNILTMTQNIEESLFLELSVLDNFKLWSNEKFQMKHLVSQKSQIKAFRDFLSDFNRNLPDKMALPVKHLSGGERQALLLAICFYLKPKVLLLDEHTSQLDPKTAEHIILQTMHFAKVHQVPCVMTTHALSHALRFGNRLLALKAGRIVYEAAGDQKKQLTRLDLLQHCY